MLHVVLYMLLLDMKNVDHSHNVLLHHVANLLSLEYLNHFRKSGVGRIVINVVLFKQNQHLGLKISARDL